MASLVPLRQISTTDIRGNGYIFLSVPSAIQNIVHFGINRVVSTFSRLDVPNLPILQIGDMRGTSTNSIMPFHNLAPILGH